MDIKKKVIILSHELPPVVGGAGVVANYIFKNLDRKKFKVSITRFVCFDNKIINYVCKIIQVIFYISYSKFFDTVIINDLFFKKIFCLLPLSNSKCIIYLHGSEPEYLLNNKRFRRRFIKLLVQSKSIVSVSVYMKEKLLRALRTESPDMLKGIESKIVIVINSIDRDVYKLKRSKDEIKVKNIATCCRLDFGKGFKDMAYIFKRIVQTEQNFHWYIAGAGKDEFFIKKLITDLGLMSNVNFLGALSSLEVSELYNKCDFMLLLSDFKESFGLAYVEASFCGCTPIGRNYYGVKEAIRHGSTGYLINKTSDAYDILLSDPIPSETLERNTKKYFEGNLMMMVLEDMF
jgi:glycosyltransferase involved in cell wall biosynthesis